ncbi:MAG: hypothetical protein IT287_08630 [Bdellovibrionaceae bacterium]|nr:hypothetical protein [Pseudobdellovibrionaceae bacterium]
METVNKNPNKKPLTAVIVAIGFAFFTISACMVYLLNSGISLTPAVMIRPSTFENVNTIVTASVQRLFPQLSEHQQWQFTNTSPYTLGAVSALAISAKQAHPSIQMRVNESLPDDSVLAPEQEMHLYVQTFLRNEFALTEECKKMKRLNYKCFVEVSLHKSGRKIKDSAAKYFLLTSYLDSHHLLLIEQ